MNTNTLKGQIILGLNGNTGIIVEDDGRTVYIVWDNKGNQGMGYNRKHVVRHINEYMKPVKMVLDVVVKQ